MQEEKEILALNAFDQQPRVRDGRRAAGRCRSAACGRSARLRCCSIRSRSGWSAPKASGCSTPMAAAISMSTTTSRRSGIRIRASSKPIRRQVGQLNTHTRYLNDVVDCYAERLLATFPPEIDHLVLTCTGSEANDLALRIAQVTTGRTGFIVTETAYHGNTAAVTDVSPSSRPGQPLPPHVRRVPAPETFRAPAGDLGQRFADSVGRAIADLEQKRRRVCGAAGRYDLFERRRLCRSARASSRPPSRSCTNARACSLPTRCSPGFGRTGAALWGFARHGVVPDIVTMGKPMGNGFPMGGVATRAALLDRFTAEVKYFNTFGGNPVAAAAGLAVLDVIRGRGTDGKCAHDRRLPDERAARDRQSSHPDRRRARQRTVHRPRTGRVIATAKEPAPEIASQMINRLASSRHPDRRRRSLRQYAEDPSSALLHQGQRGYVHRRLRRGSARDLLRPDLVQPKEIRHGFQKRKNRRRCPFPGRGARPVPRQARGGGSRRRHSRKVHGA